MLLVAAGLMNYFRSSQMPPPPMTSFPVVLLSSSQNRNVSLSPLSSRIWLPLLLSVIMEFSPKEKHLPAPSQDVHRAAWGRTFCPPLGSSWWPCVRKSPRVCTKWEIRRFPRVRTTVSESQSSECVFVKALHQRWNVCVNAFRTASLDQPQNGRSKSKNCLMQLHRRHVC